MNSTLRPPLDLEYDHLFPESKVKARIFGFASFVAVIFVANIIGNYHEHWYLWGVAGGIGYYGAKLLLNIIRAKHKYQWTQQPYNLYRANLWDEYWTNTILLFERNGDFDFPKMYDYCMSAWKTALAGGAKDERVVDPKIAESNFSFQGLTPALEKQRIAMIERYLINQYFNGLSEEEFERVTSLPEHQKAAECARMEKEAFSIVQKVGMPGVERLMDAYYERLRRKGELRRDIPAYEEYFKFVDMGGKA